MSGRFSWVLALIVVAVSGALLGLAGSDDSAGQSPVAVPASAESARADAVRAEFPGGDRIPAILVVSRTDDAPLTPTDVAATEQAWQRMLSTAGAEPNPGPPVLVAEDDKAAIATVPLNAELSGFALNDAVKELRDAAGDGLPSELRAEVTGGPAFGTDIA